MEDSLGGLNLISIGQGALEERERAKANADNLQWEWTTSQACLLAGETEWGNHPFEFQQVSLKIIYQHFLNWTESYRIAALPASLPQ